MWVLGAKFMYAKGVTVCFAILGASVTPKMSQFSSDVTAVTLSTITDLPGFYRQLGVCF